MLTGAAAGKLDNAAQFVAANAEYLSHPSNADLQTGNVDFTIAAWVSLSTVANCDIVTRWATPTNGEYALVYFSSRFRFAVTPDGTAASTVTVVASSLGAASAGTWYLVVGWHDALNNTLNIQINNGAVESTPHTTGVYPSAAPFGLSRASYVGGYVHGMLDEVGFWKRLLTADERALLWNSGAGLSYPFS